MNQGKFIIGAVLTVMAVSCQNYTDKVSLDITQPIYPLVTLKKDCPALRLEFVNTTTEAYKLEKLEFSLEGSTEPDDISGASIYVNEKPGRLSREIIPDSLIASVKPSGNKISFSLNETVDCDTIVYWLCLNLKDDAASADKRIKIACTKADTNEGLIAFNQPETEPFRIGVALRQIDQDGVCSSRIPGLITAKNGSLIAMYDARRDSYDDLQGDIDLAINISDDGGSTWSPMQVVLTMGNYGGLPKKYNGVSDGNIMVDETNGDIYVAGCWMHGVLDPKTGEWVKELSDTSTVWNHQWQSGSKAGFELNQTCQFLITKSTDNGKTWSEPRNLTRDIKKKDWWLLAPAPGRGITMEDGTLVMPIEGRNEVGKQFSTIMWSRDKGETWNVGEPAFYNVNECQVVELSDHSLMLNMRLRSNRHKQEHNGRAICVTKDMGKTWTEHPTSQSALIEPACQGGLHRHNYTRDGEKRHILIFTNPSDKDQRVNFTLKVSFDDGETWPEEYWMLLDKEWGYGYSCITSIDEETIGIFYEGSQAEIQFQAIPLKDILKEK